MRSIFTNYSRNPQQKVSFFIYFCLWLFRVGVTDCKWRMKLTKCCYVSGLVKQATAIKKKLKTVKCTEKNAIWERWVVSTIVLPKSALRKRSRCYWKTRSNVERQYAPTRTDNQREKYMKKTHLLLRILAVISNDCDDISFVTKNNLKRSRNFWPSPWILPIYSPAPTFNFMWTLVLCLISTWALWVGTSQWQLYI